MKAKRTNQKPQAKQLAKEVSREFKGCDSTKVEQWFKASQGGRNRQLNLNALKKR